MDKKMIKAMIFSLLMLIFILPVEGFTLHLPPLYCKGTAGMCGEVHNKAYCNKQMGCTWIGGDIYGSCEGQHKPCLYYFNKPLCEQNFYCEWRGR